MSSNLKPSSLDVPLGAARQRALTLLADRWALWLLLAVHESHGARFTELAAQPGLSRRVLAERLRQLVAAGLLRTEQYQARPPRSRYLLTDRGLQVRRLALATVHVAAGGLLDGDPVELSLPQAMQVGAGDARQHPADALLAADLAAAARIHAATIAPLARYDSRYRTSLVETLQVWLSSDASVSVTAARMYAHRHTIRYRLERIRDLTGLDVSTSADREQLALGLRARRILKQADRLDDDLHPTGQ